MKIALSDQRPRLQPPTGQDQLQALVTASAPRARRAAETRHQGVRWKPHTPHQRYFHLQWASPLAPGKITPSNWSLMLH